jgi:hypothetical protein
MAQHFSHGFNLVRKVLDAAEAIEAEKLVKSAQQAQPAMLQVQPERRQAGRSGARRRRSNLKANRNPTGSIEAFLCSVLSCAPARRHRADSIHRPILQENPLVAIPCLRAYHQRHASSTARQEHAASILTTTPLDHILLKCDYESYFGLSA